MPTIEIASISSKGLGLNQADFDVAIIEETKLKSHRGVFYDLLRQQRGVIVHIGNPNHKDNKSGGFFAGGIVDWSLDPSDYIYIPANDSADQDFDDGADQKFILKFLDQYKPDIEKLLKIALDKSPIGKACFLTDYHKK